MEDEPWHGAGVHPLEVVLRDPVQMYNVLLHIDPVDTWAFRASSKWVAESIRFLAKDEISAALRETLNATGGGPEGAVVRAALERADPKKDTHPPGCLGAPSIDAAVLDQQDAGQPPEPDGVKSPWQLLACAPVTLHNLLAARPVSFVELVYTRGLSADSRLKFRSCFSPVAAWYGRLDVLRWAWDMGMYTAIGGEWGRTVDHAMAKGHCDVFNWALARAPFAAVGPMLERYPRGFGDWVLPHWREAMDFAQCHGWHIDSLERESDFLLLNFKQVITRSTYNWDSHGPPPPNMFSMDASPGFKHAHTYLFRGQPPYRIVRRQGFRTLLS